MAEENLPVQYLSQARNLRPILRTWRTGLIRRLRAALPGTEETS